MIKEKKYKIVILNGISAVLIVLLWFILYYLFSNHFWRCSSKEECLMIHQGTEWKFWNDISFCIVYLVIEVVNCQVTDLSFWNYALVQAILDFVIFFSCLGFMERTSWFVPIIGVSGFNAEYTEFKALIYYFQQYIFAFFASYLVMGMIYGIRKFYRCRKK